MERYADAILRIGYTWLGDMDDAKDICQTVLIRAGRGGPSLPRFGPGAGVGGAAERQRLQELEKERLVPPPGAAGGGPAPGGGGAGAGGRRAAGPGGPAAGSQTANTPAACGGPWRPARGWCWDW